MSSFDFESKSLFEGLHKIDEGVYLKHYGIELTGDETKRGVYEVDSFGDMESKVLLWQKQMDMFSESLALKSEIVVSLSGHVIPQADMAKEGGDRGWFHPDCGSSFDDLVELLRWNSFQNKDDSFTVDVMTHSDLAELTECVDSRDEVICYVNMLLMDQADYLYPGLNADGWVHVIGLILSNENGDFVIVNDMSDDHGAGKKIPLENFLNAWAASDYSVITIARR